MHTLKNSSGSGEAAVEAGASAFSSAAGGGSRLTGLSAGPVFASSSSSPAAAAAAAAALAFSESPMKSRGFGALAWMASFTAAVSAAWMPLTCHRQGYGWRQVELGVRVRGYLEVGADILSSGHRFCGVNNSVRCWRLFHTRAKLAKL